jgi:cold shock CspA family protein
MTTDLLSHFSPLSQRERIAQSLVSDMAVFEALNRTLLRKLRTKNLVVQKFGDQFLFETVFEIFAVITEKSLAEAPSIRNRIRTTLQKVQDWSIIHSSFGFLNVRKDILAHCLENMDSPLYFGFFFLLNCRFYSYNLKVYQLQENGSLVSCQVGSSKLTEHLRIAVFHSPHGPRFAILNKATVKFAPGSESELAAAAEIAKLDVSDKRTIRKVFNNFNESPSDEPGDRQPALSSTTLTDQEVEIQTMLVSQLGVCPQLFVAYGQSVRDKEIMQFKKKELWFLYHNIVKSVPVTSCAIAQSLEAKSPEVRSPDGRSPHRIDRKGSGFITMERKGSGIISEVKEVSFGNKLTSSGMSRKQAPTLTLKNIHALEEKTRPNVTSMGNLGFVGGDRLTQTVQITKKERHFQLNSLISPRANALIFAKPKRQDSSLNRDPITPPPHSTATTYGICPSLLDIQDPLPTLGGSMAFGRWQSVRTPTAAELSRKPQVLEYNAENRVTGGLKFYNEQGRFGFIVGDKDGADIFFHYKDMEQNGIPEDILTKSTNQRFSYVEMKYAGRKPDSKKAVDIKLINQAF